jgi:hypothetical protein
MLDTPNVDDPNARPAVQDGHEAMPARHSRRLSDKVLIAFHQACDQGDYEIAEQLLHVLETILKNRQVVPDQNRRRSMDSLVAAHERLWFLRHPNTDQ